MIPARKAKVVAGLRACLNGFVSRHSDVKSATFEIWRQPIRNLVDHFGATHDIAVIIEADALDFRQWLINSKLAATTVAKRLRFVRTFFHDARLES